MTTKSLKNGADYPVRTDDPLITNQFVSLILNDIFVNHFPSYPLSLRDLPGRCKLFLA